MLESIEWVVFGLPTDNMKVMKRRQAEQMYSLAVFFFIMLAGAERVFPLLDEQPEADERYVELVNAKELPDGTLTETQKRTGLWTCRHPHKADGTVTYTRL